MTRLVASLLILCVPGCAARASVPVADPIVEIEPASAPSSMPSCVPRPWFDQLAKMYVSLWREKGEALADCREQGDIAAANYAAATAQIAQLDMQLRMARIFAPVGAVLAAAAAGFLGWKLHGQGK